MLEDIVQKIAESTSEIIGYEVIITDEHSIIIGASDTSRLGEFHEASVQIIKTGKPNPDTVNIMKLEGTKPGFALPIEISNKIIGSFGITGEREKVKTYCYLLKKQIEMMIYQEMYMKSALIKEKALKDLIQEISSYDHHFVNESYLITRGQELGYNLKTSFIAVAIHLSPQDASKNSVKIQDDTPLDFNVKTIRFELHSIIKRAFNNTNDLIAEMAHDKFCILHSLHSDKPCHRIYDKLKMKSLQIIQEFKKRGFSTFTGIGAPAENMGELSQSYKDAWQALKLGRQINSPAPIYFIHELILEDLISSIPKNMSERYMLKTLTVLKMQPDWPELSKTITVWCESGFNQRKAARILFIHRNTLHYRLAKIQDLSGIDVHNHKYSIMLYLAVLMDKWTS
ncbi:sugar diacid recognition domain-containing protein [Neobacillus mesonae]|uniref:CdaR family transcriptional regulator n=1 Tax=Neobacillus mesonae TaxID=1193713 RepID=UPI00203F1500|nr:sugar diacid recognition domain-containing protein [Neobacillus mesonae]MCM3569302.1 helix-turn-helix domain-containing protein [Neobacillus mesonae]